MNIVRAASFAIHKIGRLSKYLDRKSIERLVHAFVSSRLDSCKSLLYGLPDYHIAKLQRVQNSAVRLVSPKRAVRVHLLIRKKKKKKKKKKNLLHIGCWLWGVDIS